MYLFNHGHRDPCHRRILGTSRVCLFEASWLRFLPQSVDRSPFSCCLILSLGYASTSLILLCGFVLVFIVLWVISEYMPSSCHMSATTHLTRYWRYTPSFFAPTSFLASQGAVPTRRAVARSLLGVDRDNR